MPEFYADTTVRATDCYPSVTICVEGAKMDVSREFGTVLLIIGGIIVWLLAKVVHYARKSERQWREVDKSKLKEWDDEAWK